jgi:hypothetical protein
VVGGLVGKASAFCEDSICTEAVFSSGDPACKCIIPLFVFATPSQSLLCCCSSWQLCADCHLCSSCSLDQHQLSRGLAACHELHQPTTASIEQAPQLSLTCEVGQRQQQLGGVGGGSLVATLDLHASMCPLIHMVDIWSTVQRRGRMHGYNVLNLIHIEPRMGLQVGGGWRLQWKLRCRFLCLSSWPCDFTLHAAVTGVTAPVYLDP